MRERVRLFGGRFTVVSRPGEGMQLRVLIPLLQGDSTS
jgi:signal transduction histidine kinase